MIMRKIKFRGKSLNDKKWVYGFYCRHDYGAQYQDKKLIKAACSVHDIWTDNGWVAVDEASIGQFTGLTDCNGKEIYEGDIICTPLNNNVVVKYGYKEHIVRHNDLVDSFAAYGWIAKNIQNGMTDFLDNDILQGKVIGNIHDNPELLPDQPTVI